MSNRVIIISEIDGKKNEMNLPLSAETPKVEEILFSRIEKEDVTKELHFSGVKLTKVPSQD